MIDIVNTANVKVLKNLLSQYDIKMKKSLGQNFLIDAGIPFKIAEISLAPEIDRKKRCVLEIGAGAGALTYALSEFYGKVVSIEYDNTLIPLLDGIFQSAENVKFIYGDFLALDLNRIISDEFFDYDIDICANLPYYITTPIIMKLLGHGANIKSMTLMLQREAAERVCAKNGANYGELAVRTAYFGTAEKKLKIPSSAFYPAPDVDSVILKITAHKGKKFVPKDESLFFRTVRAAFMHRRKTLVNSLCDSFSDILRNDITETVIKSVGNEKIRAEEMDLAQFIALADNIADILIK